MKGGGVSAKQRQASWEVMSAKAKLMKEKRAVESGTRRAYRDVQLGAEKVHADRQALLSRQSALASISAAFAVGDRAMADVLDAESDLFDAKNQLQKDLRAWILSLLKLKQMVGQLSFDDLQDLAGLMSVVDNPSRVDQKESLPSSDFRPYAIQLARGTHEDFIYQFMRDHDLVGKAYPVLLNQDGDKSFVVLMGAFYTQKEAQEALEGLPSSLKTLRPWVRRLKAKPKTLF